MTYIYQVNIIAHNGKFIAILYENQEKKIERAFGSETEAKHCIRQYLCKNAAR